VRVIHLHGALKEQFGGPFKFDVASPAEAVRACIHQLKGFRQAIQQGEYQVIRGDRQQGFALEPETLTLAFGRCRDLHLVPVVSGAGGGGRSGGVIKTIIGVTLAAVAIAGAAFTGGMSLGLLGVSATIGTAGAAATAWGAVASLGVALTFTGVSQMLSAPPEVRPIDYESRDEANSRPSFLFNGPVNSSEQGLPIPLVYGRMRVGSIVVSSGLSAERLD